MAKMRGDDVKLYPRLAAFLQNTLAAAHADAKTLAAFIKHSTLSPAEAKKALTQFDTFPIIEIAPLGLGETGQRALGRFDPERRNSVFLAQDAAERFNNIDSALPKAQEAIQAVVLHEMVHWGDFFDDSQQAGDPGMRFEIDVYDDWHARWFEPAPLPTALALADGKRFVFPVTGTIGGGTSYWGKNIRANGTRSHHGIDIFNEIGTPVHAIADGEVLGGNQYRKGPTWAAQLGNYGQMIDIDHGNGLISRYAHLNTIEVPPGSIRQGTRLGTLGASGTQWGQWVSAGKPGGKPPLGATHPHLHFEIRRAEGKPFQSFEDTFDPTTFFEGIPQGKDARNTVVTALQPGVPLHTSVTPQPDPERGPPGASFATGHKTAYPNLNYAPTDPRGLRNNNPGNIRKDGTDWAGLRTPDMQLDPQFFQFIGMEWGIRAMARILRTYERDHNIRSLRHMSERWAPNADHNDAEQHARNVLKHAEGVVATIDDAISLSDKDIAFGVIRGIMVAENGSKARTVADDTVLHGVSLRDT